MLDFIKKLISGAAGADLSQVLKNGAIIVDVRSPEEFRGGSVRGAINIPLQMIGQSAQIEKLKKTGKPIVTCCASGMRSGSAASTLKQAGLEAYNGGTWQSVAGKV